MRVNVDDLLIAGHRTLNDKVPTICAWSVEVVEHVAARVPECDVGIDKQVQHE